VTTLNEHEKDREQEHEREEPRTLEDLDVPESESEDVKGGETVHTYKIHNAWPRKWSG
jgi:hypothetical protein